MQNNRVFFFLLVGFVTIACSPSEAKSSGCAQKLQGTWAFGRAPYGCAMSSSIAKPLESQYHELAYNDTNSGSGEDKRFTSTMHDFLANYAKDYYQRRKPSATENEVESWTRLVLATANQESYWTQYRYGRDSLFRILKGDGNHGYGLMQIDDRSHQQFINSGKVYDINPHMIYALDMLYDMRDKAAKKPCSGHSDADSLNRSAYSAYNGGPGSKCRWLDSHSRWASNDRGFWDKYSQRLWEKNLVASN